jgi:hypothetical protein
VKAMTMLFSQFNPMTEERQLPLGHSQNPFNLMTRINILKDSFRCNKEGRLRHYGNIHLLAPLFLDSNSSRCHATAQIPMLPLHLADQDQIHRLKDSFSHKIVFLRSCHPILRQLFPRMKH